MNIVQMPVPSGQYSQKSPYSMAPKGFVMHNTAGPSSAREEAAYMINRNAEGSMHYYVDETEAVQTLPTSRNAWHATDGGNGYANRNLIGIEICRSSPNDAAFNATTFTKCEESACWLAAKLCVELGIVPNDQTVRWHKEFAATACPYRSAQKGNRGRIVTMVQGYYNSMKNSGSSSGSSSGSASAGSAKYKVQIGAFKDKANAETLAAKAKRKGFETYIAKDGGVYKVQLGAFSTEAKAKALGDKAKSAGFDVYITGLSTSTASASTAAPSPSIKVGSTVRINQGAKDYNGTSLLSFVYNRNNLVSEINGDRAVVNYGGVVVGAFRISDLTLV